MDCISQYITAYFSALGGGIALVALVVDSYRKNKRIESLETLQDRLQAVQYTPNVKIVENDLKADLDGFDYDLQLINNGGHAIVESIRDPKNIFKFREEFPLLWGSNIDITLQNNEQLEENYCVELVLKDDLKRRFILPITYKNSHFVVGVIVEDSTK